MTRIRNKTTHGLSNGAIFSVSRTFKEGDMQAFADITRDYNPVHFDNRHTARMGKNEISCHKWWQRGIRRMGLRAVMGNG